ncbi:MAG: response regulator [Dysgonamonadaceae bacterium]|jgi:signal transduction histidine kinase/DNA-binding response OmpR family regulator|nr:response regulator [Dysgonamonadaceae bacterium]
MRQNYIKIIVVTGYILLVSLAVFGIVWIYRELVNFSKTDKLYEQPKELVIITNTLAALYRTESAVGLLTIETNPELKSKYDLLMNTVFAQIDSLKKISIDSSLRLHVDSLNTLLIQKKENTEELVRLMDRFENKTVKEITRSVSLSKKDRDDLDELIFNSKTTEVARDTVVKATTKKGFFKRIRDAIASNYPDSVVYISNQMQSHSENIIPPDLTDTIIEFIREVNFVNQKKNVFFVRQVVQQQNEIYRMNENTISRINMIVTEIEAHEYKKRMNNMEERENTLKRTSDAVSTIAYMALVIAIIFMSWTIYSLSESQKMHIEIVKAKKEVDKLLSMREQLMLMIAHDIKAPVGSIIGYLELMKKNNSSEKNSCYVENMQQSAVHILNLIRDILDFYSFDYEQQKINPSLFSPYILIYNIFESFIPEANQKKINFNLEINLKEEEKYVSDPYRIRQVLNNLLSNAIKYTPDKGAVVMTASVEMFEDKPRLVLSVKDTGPGIKDSDREKIFEEFRRLEYSGVGITGAGLGLNITNKLLQLLGGAIEIDSVFGEGSTFTARIPIHSTFGDIKEIIKSDSSEFIDKKKDISLDASIKILFIDDDKAYLNLFAEMMKSEGLHPFLCSNAEDALQLIIKQHFDIVFSDIQMEGMSGFDVAKQIRAIAFEQSRHIPVIALSARSDIPKEGFKEAGFSDFLPKPFTLEQLFETIQLHTSISKKSKKSYSSGNKGFLALTKFAGGDAAAAKSIISSFVEENKKNLESLRTAFTENDWRKITAICHKMISMMRMISAEDLVSLLQEYENGSHSEENKTLLFSLIEEKIQEAENLIRN